MQFVYIIEINNMKNELDEYLTSCLGLIREDIYDSKKVKKLLNEIYEKGYDAGFDDGFSDGYNQCLNKEY